MSRIWAGDISAEDGCKQAKQDVTPLLPLVRLRTLGLVTTKLSPASAAAVKTFRARGTSVVDH